MGGVKADAVHIGMNAGVCTAAPLNICFFTDYLLQRFLKLLLYGIGVFLHLPAMVASAVIHYGYHQISHFPIPLSFIAR